MPSSHLKLVMNMDINDKISARNYHEMTRIALSNFYGTYAVNRLEERLSELLNKHTKIGNEVDNNLLAHLMEKDTDEKK